MSLTVSDLGTAAKPAVSKAAYGVITGVQYVPSPAARVAGIAATLLLACRHLRLNVADVLGVADNMVFDQDRKVHPNFAATRDYIRGEL